VRERSRCLTTQNITTDAVMPPAATTAMEEAREPSPEAPSELGAMAFQMATHGSRVKIPSESRIEFVLTRDAVMAPHEAASSQGGGSSPSPDNSAELDELEHEIDQLSSRAAAVNKSLQHLQQQQAAAGYGLRGDVVSRQSSLQLNLSKAQGAIQQGDAVRAKRYANLAAADVEFLEHFLGR
jgi:hypothetical protein